MKNLIVGILCFWGIFLYAADCTITINSVGCDKPQQILCNIGQSVRIGAIPSQYAHFTQWTDGNTDNPRTITADGDATYTAQFAADTCCTITLASEGCSQMQHVICTTGQQYKIRAIPSKNYLFQQWTDGNTDNPRTITASSDHVYTAQYMVDTTGIVLTVYSSECNTPNILMCSQTQEVTLNAYSSNTNSQFLSWSDGNVDNPRQLVVTQDCTLTAYFCKDVDVPYPDNVITEADCSATTTGESFRLKELFRCEGAHNIATPLVADLDGDSITEILAAHSGSNQKYTANQLLIYDGRNGNLISTNDVCLFSQSGQAIAIGDVDKDGLSEVFIMGMSEKSYDGKYLYCYKYNKSTHKLNQVWKSTEQINERYIPAIADINNDGIAELVCGPYIYNAATFTLLLDATQRAKMVATGMGFGAPNGIKHASNYFEYYLPALADMDRDYTLELCAGNTIYKINLTNPSSTTGNTLNVLRQANNLFTQEEVYPDYNYDGQTMVLDFDGDGDMDICVLGASHAVSDTTTDYYLDIYVWDGSSNGEIIAYTRIALDQSVWSRGDVWSTASIPFAGDIDNNGLPEILFNVLEMGMYAYTYDKTCSGNMRQLCKNQSLAESCGFTVFDFNIDGKKEIVSKTDKKFSIVGGDQLNAVLSEVDIVSQTMDEYPVIADVNGDGSAEILIAMTNNYRTNRNGWISVYGAYDIGTWASARPVWNQLAYNSVNINQNLTVPQYQYDITTVFPNGTRPFNAFLAQQPMIDSIGEILNPAADIAITASSYVLKNDSVEVTLSLCNTGDANLIAPYEITVYKDKYKGSVIQVDTIREDLAINDCKTMSYWVSLSSVCPCLCEFSLVAAINDEGHGIAQHGYQQGECDTTNNTAILEISRPAEKLSFYQDSAMHDTIYGIASVCPVCTNQAKLTIYTNRDSRPTQYITDKGCCVEVQVVPESCNVFAGWSDDNTDNPRTITVTEDTIITAIFERIPYTIQIKSTDENIGSVGGEIIEE